MSTPSSSALAQAGRLVMVNITGTELDAEQAQFLREHHIRAVCVFRRNLGSEDQIRRLTAQLREVMGPQALIGIDQEGGSVVRATSLPQPPAAMALGAVGDDALAQAVGAAVARGVRHLGFNWNFAPVLDVNNNPANPVIGERSFSADPQQVARLAGAWMRGALSEGVACCVKHFPGHGDTHVDSHHDLPVVDKSLSALRALELLPFEALAARAPAVMTAHIVYPQLDPEHPATLSRRILGGLLREELGYDGVVITDALEMKAIHDRYGHARAAVMTLQAGADMAMALGPMEEQRAAVLALAEAIDGGVLPPARVQRALQRLDELAARYPAGASAYPAAQRQDDEGLMRRAWGAALCTVGDARPPAAGAPLRVVTQASVACDGVSEAGLPAEQVRSLFDGFADVELVTVPDLGALPAGALPMDHRVNVLVSNQRKRYPAGAPRRGAALHIALWNPFHAADVDAPTVVTWGYADGALQALKDWLHGRLQPQATAPAPLR